MGSLRAALGWDGRVLALAALSAVNLATIGAAALTALVATVLITECSLGLLRRDPAPTRAVGPVPAPQPGTVPDVADSA